MRVTTMAAIGILILGTAGAGVWKFTKPVLEQRAKIQTSDAAKLKGTVEIGVDNFIGYFPLCSSYQRSLMRNEGYDLKCADDDAAYADRFQKLKDGKTLQFAVATVDSYELNALQSEYPGLMVAVIDRSNGADGAVACNDKVKNIDDLKKGDLKVAYSPGTPSEHLVKVVATRFGIPQLREKDKSKWLTATKNSAEAAKKCQSGEVDVAVMWEPDITKTLRKNPKATKLIGTDFSPNTIVDVLLVRREFATRNPEVVSTLLRNYFTTLLHYRQKPDEAVRDALDYVNASATGEARLTPDDVKSAMRGVSWVNLGENATLWFGVAEPEPGTLPKFGLIEVIESTTRILSSNGDFGNRMPDTANTMIESRFIKSLYETGFATDDKVNAKDADSLSRDFSELTDEQWTTLRPVGTLQTRPVNFPQSSDDLSVAARENIDQIAEAIKSFPKARVVIEGHTSTRGDKDENLELSQNRADAVARYLQVTFQMSPNRIRAVGFGGTKPLAQNKGESNREYLGRLPRVVVKLVTENY